MASLSTRSRGGVGGKLGRIAGLRGQSTAESGLDQRQGVDTEKCLGKWPRGCPGRGTRPRAGRKERFRSRPLGPWIQRFSFVDESTANGGGSGTVFADRVGGGELSYGSSS